MIYKLIDINKSTNLGNYKLSVMYPFFSTYFKMDDLEQPSYRTLIFIFLNSLIVPSNNLVTNN